jgi:hypothetical protein
MIQEIHICETTSYEIIGLLRSKYMLYKADCKQGYKFLPHGIKGLHKLQTPKKQVESNVQCLINLCVKWMELEMVDKMSNIYWLIFGRIFTNEVMKLDTKYVFVILWLSFFSKISVGVLVY